MVEFASWSMPVQYDSIVEEHHATRSAIGMFDVSHMARFRFNGSCAGAFLDSITTRRVNDVGAGKVRYALICNEAGGILDDVLVYQLADLNGAEYYAMVVNASNRAKIADWIQKQLDGHDLGFVDQTEQTAMFAVQGPRALEIVDPMCEVTPSSLNYYRAAVTQMGGRRVCLSRTGYTGEDGCEIICDAEHAVDLWSEVMQRGESVGARPAGLGARDTLRLEAAMPLYGHELNEQINPVQAGLGFAINLKDREFVGKSAIVEAKNDPELPIRIGLELDGKRAAREGCSVVANGKNIGEVTSGTSSPTLRKPISMAYVQQEFAKTGDQVEIDNRGKMIAARIVDLPFYKRSS